MLNSGISQKKLLLFEQCLGGMLPLNVCSPSAAFPAHNVEVKGGCVVWSHTDCISGAGCAALLLCDHKQLFNLSGPRFPYW